MWRCASRWTPRNIKKEVRQHLVLGAAHVHLLPANVLLAWTYETVRLDHTFIADFCSCGRGGGGAQGPAGVPDTHLDVCAQFLEDLVDLIFEPSAQHLVGFIQDEHLDQFRICNDTPAASASTPPNRLLAPFRPTNTHTDAPWWACRTHVPACPPLCEEPQPGVSVFRYGDWSRRCRRGMPPPCSRPERGWPSGSAETEARDWGRRHRATEQKIYREGEVISEGYGLSIARVSPERWCAIISLSPHPVGI